MNALIRICGIYIAVIGVLFLGGVICESKEMHKEANIFWGIIYKAHEIILSIIIILIAMAIVLYL